MHQIGPFPATLFFPASVVDELNEICETLGYTAVNGHSAQWKKKGDRRRRLMENAFLICGKSSRRSFESLQCIAVASCLEKHFG
jgi:hypothetical protein